MFKSVSTGEAVSIGMQAICLTTYSQCPILPRWLRQSLLFPDSRDIQRMSRFRRLYISMLTLGLPNVQLERCM